jgi:hypothetical protein
MTYAEAGKALGLHNANMLRYAAATGTVLLRWDGARQAIVWTVPPPRADPRAARLELTRRFLHVYGPATAEAFNLWSGIGPRASRSAFNDLQDSLTSVQTPIGDACILTSDEDAFRAEPQTPDAQTPDAQATDRQAGVTVRLLPSGDPYLLLYGADRDLLVPDAYRRDQLWTPRVWPGGLLIDGEVSGTWRRANAVMDVQPWRPLTDAERDAVLAEAQSLPVPGTKGGPAPIVVRWAG